MCLAHLVQAHAGLSLHSFTTTLAQLGPVMHSCVHLARRQRVHGGPAHILLHAYPACKSNKFRAESNAAVSHPQLDCQQSFKRLVGVDQAGKSSSVSTPSTVPYTIHTGRHRTSRQWSSDIYSTHCAHTPRTDKRCTNKNGVPYIARSATAVATV